MQTFTSVHKGAQTSENLVQTFCKHLYKAPTPTVYISLLCKSVVSIHKVSASLHKVSTGLHRVSTDLHKVSTGLHELPQAPTNIYKPFAKLLQIFCELSINFPIMFLQAPTNFCKLPQATTNIHKLLQTFYKHLYEPSMSLHNNCTSFYKPPPAVQ